MKTISIKNPWAYLICSGEKNIENRTWPTKFRGRVLVHASAKPIDLRVPSAVFLREQWDALTYDQRLLVRSNTLPNSAIIGSVEIVDCTVNHESIWAEKTTMAYLGKLTIECQKPVYNWVLANPVLFAKPILNVKGRLSFWEYPMTEEEYLNHRYEFKSGFSYACHHIPSNENWYILGIDVKGNRVCAAGWPPSIGNLSDCTDFEELKPLIPKELSYRIEEFGTNWI